MTPAEKIAKIVARHGPVYRAMRTAEDAEWAAFERDPRHGPEGYDRASTVRCDEVYAMAEGLDDHEIAALWDALSEEARDFGREQGDEEAHGLVHILAWGLAYTCEHEVNNPQP